MRKLLFFIPLSLTLQCFALTHSKPMTSKAPLNQKWEISAEVVSLFNKSLYLEVSHRVHPNISLGIQGGVGQTSDRALEWLSDILQDEEVVVDKDTFRLGAHLKLFVTGSNTKGGFFSAIKPTWVRGYKQKITGQNVQVTEKKELKKKGQYVDVEVESDDDASEDDKDKKKKKKTKRKWVEPEYRTIKEVNVDDPESEKFGHFFELPLALGYQWKLDDSGVFSVSVEPGIQYNFINEESRGFVNVNFMVGVAL